MKSKNPLPYALEYRYYNLSSDFPIFALLGERWFLPDDEITYLHFHNCLEIGYCYKGTGELIVEDSRPLFSQDSISIICANTVHRAKSTKGTISLWEYLYIDTEKLLKDFYPKGFSHHEIFTLPNSSLKNIIQGNNNPFIRSLVCNILHELRFEKCNYRDVVKGLCLSLLIELARENPINNQNETETSHVYLSIMPALTYIDKYYMNPIKIDELALLCGLSPSHFRRLFLASMHSSPLAYINHIRIRNACDLLSHTDMSVLDVSLNVGFTTLSSFNRQFQKAFHIAPLTWRKNTRSTFKKNYTYSVFDF
ncbi:MAG: AraC family transcriptional regulator [Blautia sp.]